MQNCVYNKMGCCRTPGITIGAHAECNTYSHASAKGGFDEVVGIVGACLNSGCKFNDQLECVSRTICVTVHGRHPDCQTYRPKE